MQEHDMSWVRTEMALAQAAPRSESGFGAWVRKNLFATPGDSILTVVSLLIVAWVTAADPELAFINAVMDRRRSHRLPDRRPGRRAAGGLVRRLLGLRQRQVRPVHVRPLPARGALARHPDRRPLRGAAGAAADPARALQGAERDPVLRGLPGRRLLPAGRRLFRPALCRDRAVGRPAGHAGDLLCRHRRLAAARHHAGARAALEDAGRQAALRRSSSRRCAACR